MPVEDLRKLIYAGNPVLATMEGGKEEENSISR